MKITVSTYVELRRSDLDKGKELTLFNDITLDDFSEVLAPVTLRTANQITFVDFNGTKFLK